jgi:hydrogenase nickel incorporation protein HypA/HybF
MHEISLINSVFQSLEQEFTAYELEKLDLIEMEIGVFSNVEPLLMQNAFRAIQETKNKYMDVKLKIESIPIKIYCKDCSTYSIISDYKFVCSKCKIANNNLVAGTEMLIKRVHFK